MKTYFKYQNLWIRVFFFIPVAILVYLIQTRLIHKLVLSDGLIYIIDGFIILLFLGLYYKVTEKYNWYIRSGEYWIEKDILIFNLNDKLVEVKFDDINEIYMGKNNLFESYHVILLIKWNKKKFKLISTPMHKDTEIYETEFMKISKLVENYSTKLKVVKDFKGNNTDYWMKNF